MRVVTVVVGQLQTNCFLVIDESTAEALIIDPGDDAELIKQKLQEEQAKPMGLVATHGHFDHVLAATDLQLSFNIPFMLSKLDLKILGNMNKSAKYFLGVVVGPPPKTDRLLKEGAKLHFGKEKLLVFETPGHTPGGISLYAPKHNLVFVGDTLFAQGGRGRTDFSYGDHKALEISIQKLLTLPQETTVYAGHGEKTTIKKEKRYYAL